MSKTTQAADIDTFALNLMLDVWKIGNSHGPDSQRKAKIQCRLIDALKEFAAPIANTPAVPDGWEIIKYENGVTLREHGYKTFDFFDLESNSGFDRTMVRFLNALLATPAINGPEVLDVNALAEFMDKTAHNCSQSWYEFAKKICEWLATPATNGREVPDERIAFIDPPGSIAPEVITEILDAIEVGKKKLDDSSRETRQRHNEFMSKHGRDVYSTTPTANDHKGGE